ncbi:MAG: citrate/2-methylcitrate synthase [Pseudomonadota bacterium]
MPEVVNVKNTGLRGVTVADTKISFIDGEKGILIYRGYRIEQLAENSTFLDVAHLLLNGSLPKRAELETFARQILEARQVPEYVFGCFKSWPKEAGPMDVLQGAVPFLAMADPDTGEETRQANVRMAIRLIARLPTLVAAWHRIRQGLEPLPSDDSLSHAANFLWQLHGKRPDEEMARDLDTCLTLHADHTFPEFASRVIAGICAETGCPFKEALNHFEAQAAQEAAIQKGVLPEEEVHRILNEIVGKKGDV